jgi:uncharacterized caspase-like protein
MPGAITKGHALLIGVGNDLPVTVKDAEALARLLSDPQKAAYPPEHVRAVTGPEATREGILSALDAFSRAVNAGEDAHAVVYYSGHGGQFRAPGDESSFFLVPHDYAPDRWRETTIADAEFTERIESMRPRRLLVFLDCCHAGGVPRVKGPSAAFDPKPVPPGLLALLDSGSGMVILASSHEQESSYVGDEYSIFTECLLDGLNGAAGDEGVVRVLRLLSYLYEEVPKRAAPNPQHPFLNKAFALSEDFVVAVAAGERDKLVPTQIAASLSDRERERLEVERERLQARYDVLSKKQTKLESTRDVETDVAVSMKLEHQIVENEASRSEVLVRLRAIEDALSA